MCHLSEAKLDLELVRRVQNGNKAAFGLLVGKYQTKVMNLVRRYVHDAAEVEDVTQEAFIKAYRGIANFRGESAFYTWLYRIAVNAAKNYLISVNRKTPINDIDAADAEQFDGISGLKEYATPERMALAGEVENTINQSIESLPEELKIAITLREIDGMSYEEIAEVMKCPIGTVRSRIFRARESIDEYLRPLLN